MQINRPETAVDIHKDITDYRSGAGKKPSARVARMLLTGRENALNNYRLGLSGGASADAENWQTPRHRHTKEQFRYVIEGEYQLTDKETLPQGWAAYFPESVYYGPQNLTPNLKLLVMQFGGPSGHGYLSNRQIQKGIDALTAKGGHFERGVYTWVDADGRRHNQDAAEAAEEQVIGRKIEYPPARYKDFVMMNPAAYSWVKDRDNQGVARKMLGSFTERDVRFEMIRLDKGAVLPVGVEASPETFFLKEGAVMHDNKLYPAQTAFGTETEEAPSLLTAAEPTEFIYMKLPTF